MKKLILFLILISIFTNAYAKEIPEYTFKDLEGEWVGIYKLLFFPCYISLRINDSGKGKLILSDNVNRPPDILDVEIVSIDKMTGKAIIHALNESEESKEFEFNIEAPVSLTIKLPITDENETNYYPVLLTNIIHLEKLKNHITNHSSGLAGKAPATASPPFGATEF